MWSKGKESNEKKDLFGIINECDATFAQPVVALKRTILVV